MDIFDTTETLHYIKDDRDVWHKVFRFYRDRLFGDYAVLCCHTDYLTDPKDNTTIDIDELNVAKETPLGAMCEFCESVTDHRKTPDDRHWARGREQDERLEAELRFMRNLKALES